MPPGLLRKNQLAPAPAAPPGLAVDALGSGNARVLEHAGEDVGGHDRPGQLGARDRRERIVPGLDEQGHVHAFREEIAAVREISVLPDGLAVVGRDHHHHLRPVLS